MLQEVIDLQNNSVVNLLYHAGKKDEVTFKAPTGSGKTHMMADFMDRTIADDEDVIFIVSSPLRINRKEIPSYSFSFCSISWIISSKKVSGFSRISFTEYRSF